MKTMQNSRRRTTNTMKTNKLFPISVLIATLNLVSIGRAPAQTFTSLGNLGGPFDSPSFLGNAVYASIHGFVLSGNTFYGTSPGDDETDYSGALGAFSTDGTAFTVHNFGYVVSPGYGPRINADGAFPNAGLVLSGPTLYGSTYYGGSWGVGTVFAVNTNGTGFTVLHNFTGGSDGANPQGGLIFSGSTLYGTTIYGGTAGAGTVFAIHTNGTGFTVLTNIGSFVGLISGNTLYGPVFKLNIDGTGLTSLHGFTALRTNSSGVYTNSDGAYPKARLILSGNTLYGTGSQGGSSGSGTVFAVSTNGTGFTTLYSFTATSNSGSPAYLDTNSDGAFPEGPLALQGNTLYGTTSDGGSGGGTLFSISFQPQLTIARSGPEFVLSWPTNVAGFDYTGFTLQCSTDLGSANWTNCTNPVTVSGAYLFVTNPISAGAQFFRLKR
jgi:uncharacterized repeat protein (TIGR03803 family)